MTRTTWLPADIEHVSRGEWRTYVPSRGLFFHGTSEENVKEVTESGIKEATGLDSIVFIWNRV